MRIIEVLDQYIAGKVTDGNKSLVEGFVEELCDEPSKNIHKLLLNFSDKHLTFESIDLPADGDLSADMMNKAENLAEKYVYALCFMKYQNPVTATFVDAVLERLGV